MKRRIFVTLVLIIGVGFSVKPAKDYFQEIAEKKAKLEQETAAQKAKLEQEESIKSKVDFQLTNYLICLRKICHLLTVHNSTFPKPESSIRYLGNEGDDFVSEGVIFDEDVEEKNSTSSVVCFRVTDSLYSQLYDKAVGTESVQQLCKLMLKPNYKIQPVDLGYINLILKTERFYYSRLNSVGRALVTLQERYSGLDMKFVLIYRQMSALKFLMEESLGKHIKVVKKK